MPDKVLDFDNRKKIYQFVLNSPGHHLRSIQRELAIPLVTLKYHLRMLEKSGLVITRKDKYYTRYYTTEKALSENEKKLISYLRQEHQRKILLFLIDKPNSTFSNMLENFKLPQSTLSFYLTQLVDAGLVIKQKSGKESLFSVSNAESIMKLLITYRPSFMDKVVDHVVEMWLEGR
jgi:predicted transcriptional regulator